jgi:imidazole glycerol phosphate synthase glutamine amidotransferase subunit
MRVGIIDLDSGNLLSMVSAIKKSGYESIVLKQPDSNVDILVLPGQGRFGFIAEQLDLKNWRSFILDWVNQDKKFIGVCVGMQMLFENSDEDNKTNGLGILKGTIKKLNHQKTPMVGWAQLDSMDSFYNNKFVYFVNSYGIPKSENCIATVNYGDEFCAIVKKGNVLGFQFHPEKSGDYGLELLKKALEN